MPYEHLRGKKIDTKHPDFKDFPAHLHGEIYKNGDAENGWYIETHATPDEIAKQNRDKIEKESRELLANTDWYVVRFMETGEAIPENITRQRENARLALQTLSL